MTEYTKFLGVIIDQNLYFHKHIQYIKGKIARGIGILYKCKVFFSQSTLLSMYNAFIYPYYNYCIAVWGNTFDCHLKPLVILQKRAIRLIVGARKYEHSDPIFDSLKILKLKEIYIYSVQLFLFKFHYNNLPQFFDDLYQCNNITHSHNTRQQEMFRTPILRSFPASRTIRASGVHIYNYFVNVLDLNCSFLTFKYRLKQHILNNSEIVEHTMK